MVAAGLYLAVAVRPAGPAARHYPAKAPATASSAVTASPSPAATPATAAAGAAVAPAVSPAAPPAAHSPTTAQTAVAATPTPAASVQLTIAEPDGTFAYTVATAGVTNACDVLIAARAAGFLKSLHMSWYASMHSNYVDDINGYKDNWTFKVNGASPKGCSLASVTQGDTISWTYQ